MLLLPIVYKIIILKLSNYCSRLFLKSTFINLVFRLYLIHIETNQQLRSDEMDEKKYYGLDYDTFFRIIDNLYDEIQAAATIPQRNSSVKTQQGRLLR